MAFATEGWRAELQFRIQEEVISTYLHFLESSSFLPDKAPEDLAVGLVSHFIINASTFGNDCRLECVKVEKEAAATGWSWEVLADRVGTGPSASIAELCHARVSVVSTEENGSRSKSRPQLPGIPKDNVTDGRITNAQAASIQAFYTQLINPGLSYDGGVGFFLLACRRVTKPPTVVYEYRTAEAVGVSPFVGSRIDRVMNRPNTGRKPAPILP